MNDITHNQCNSTDVELGKKSVDEKYRKILGMIGIAKRSGKIVSGTPQVLAEIRSDKQRPKIGVVLLTDGCSKNTQKQVTNACEYYHVPLRKITVSPGDLGHAIGKLGEVCSVVITGDTGITDAVLKRIDDFEQIKHPDTAVIDGD